MGSFPGLGRSPGAGNGNPLQNSCLENPMDIGAWQAIVSPQGWKELDMTERLSTAQHYVIYIPFLLMDWGVEKDHKSLEFSPCRDLKKACFGKWPLCLMCDPHRGWRLASDLPSPCPLQPGRCLLSTLHIFYTGSGMFSGLVGRHSLAQRSEATGREMFTLTLV